MVASESIPNHVKRQFIERLVRYSNVTEDGVELSYISGDDGEPMQTLSSWAYPGKDLIEGLLRFKLATEDLNGCITDVVRLVDEAKTALEARLIEEVDVDDSDWERHFREHAGLVMWASEELEGWRMASSSTTSTMSIKSRYKNQ